MPCEVCGGLVRVDDDVRRKRIHCSELCRSRAGRTAGLFERPCGHCGRPMDGRADQKYCSATCRIAARRSGGTSIDATDVDREVGIVDDLRLYLGQVGTSRLTAQLSPEAKRAVIEALEKAAASLRSQVER